MIKFSNELITMVKKFEGLYLHAYRCSSDVLTIGYGHTDNVKAGDVITEKEADTFLYQDLSEAYNYVLHYIKKYNFTLTINQIEALTSFTFNCGSGNLNKLLSNCKTIDDIPKKMISYNKNAYGTVLSGLVKRRNSEIEMFLEGGGTQMFRTIQKGSKNVAVRILQILLNEVGGSLKVDGVFGSITQSAVITYQKNHMLTADGIVGQVTWNSLLKAAGFIV